MHSSLRGTLLGWFGLTLAVSVAGFGWLLYDQVETAGLRSVDMPLAERAQAVAASLEWDVRDGWELEISDEYVRGLTERGYFRVIDADGAVVYEAGAVPLGAARGEPGFHTRGDLREVVVAGPMGLRIATGRSIADQRDALGALLIQIVLGGFGLVGFALLGGAWLAGRVVRPIEGVAAAAAAIDEHDLGRRLQVERVPLELRPLAATFNGTLDRLEAAFGRLTRFTADASHELRTPLAVLRTELELALRRERDPEEYRQALGTSLRAARRMSDLVEGLLVLARADAGSAAVERGSVQLDSAAREALDAVDGSAADRAIHVDTALESVGVRGDRGLLREAIENLLSNAVRYNEDGGNVRLAVSRDGADALVRVSDDGPGIPHEAQARLFDRFYRVDAARSRERGGSGLGLSIVRWIADAHGGTVAVESEPGAGCTFTLRLPAAG